MENNNLNFSTAKPHKFFERFLDNDLEDLAKELEERYVKIKNATLFGVTPVTDQDIWQESNSVSTMKWQQYNVFQETRCKCYFRLFRC